MSADNLESIVTDLEDCNFDVRADAARKVRHDSLKILERQDLAEDIVFALVYNLDQYFDRPWQLGLFDHGLKYYPPNEEFRHILRDALVSMVGSIFEPGEAILAILKCGTVRGKIKAAEWFATRKMRDPLKGTARDVLEHLSKSENDRLSLAAKYGLTCFGALPAEDFSNELAEKYLRMCGDPEMEAQIEGYAEMFMDMFFLQLLDACVNHTSLAGQRVKARSALRRFLGSTVREQESFASMLLMTVSRLADDEEAGNRKCAIMLLLDSLDVPLDRYSDDELKSVAELVEIHEFNSSEQLARFAQLVREELARREMDRLLGEATND